MNLIRYMGDPTTCGASNALIDKKIRTTDVPCGMWCTFNDFRGWRAVTRELIESVLKARPDLPGEYKRQIADLSAEVAAMPESAWNLGERTARLAKIYEWVNCVATWDFKASDPPSKLPEKQETPTDPFSSIKGMMMLALGILIISKIGGRR